MTLAPGSRVGPYEVTGSLGAGGMGEVYRAYDSRLHRDVALKVLPEVFASDPGRLARFQREAQVLASLNHPNIAAIHGLEESGDHGAGVALVLELVEGPTLADRLAHGALPLDEALRIARQVADALEAAHERGVVHRDLKPANIKVRDDGTVKVLDFGLAKAFASDGDSQAQAVTQSPTLSSPAMTRAGIILGTAAYMAPEQARGKSVDKRADIWAFGVVLFESLTGHRLFAGSEVSDTLAFVLTKEPDWALLPESTPPPVRRLLRRCLEKDRGRRLADVADARLDIEEALSSPASGSVAAVAEPQGSPWRRSASWVVAAAAVAVLAVTLVTWAPWQQAAPAQTIRALADVGAGAFLVDTPDVVTLSRDGTTMAFVARSTSSPLTPPTLYVRRLDRLDGQALAGTERAAMPFFSPDGQWVGFFADGALKKVPVTGGAAVPLCNVEAPGGGWWGDAGTIVFAKADGLWRVSAAGGKPEQVAAVAPGQPPPFFPQVLPGGGAVLYAQPESNDLAESTILVRGLPRGEAKVVQRGGGLPLYAASGHLTFVRGGTLFAVPFDLKALEARGNAVPIADNVGMGTRSISTNGVLVYRPIVGDSTMQPAGIMWLARTGALSPLRAAPSTWGFPRFSPDGRRLALVIYDGRQTDIWVYDWTRDILTRVTSDPGNDLAPVWTPDGTRLVFGSTRKGNDNRPNVYWQRADGTGEAQRLTESSVGQLPDSFSPDGRVLAFHQGDPTTTRQSLMILPIDGSEATGWKAGTPRTFVGGPFLKANMRFSPDGKWIAYSTNDSGRFEIFVQPFPGPGDRIQVSSGGGNLALWSPTKPELYYAASGQRRLMVVPYTTTGGMFTPGKPQPWSDTSFSSLPPINGFGPGFDIHPDGQRFVVAPPEAESSAPVRPSQLVFVFNVFDELRRLAP